MDILKVQKQESKKDKDFPTAFVELPNGKKLYFHSRVRPTEERSIIEERNKKADTILSIGLGLGYQWQIKNIHGPLKRIIIFCEDFTFVKENLEFFKKIWKKEAKIYQDENGFEYVWFQLPKDDKGLQLWIFSYFNITEGLNFLFQQLNAKNFLISNFVPVLKALESFQINIVDLQKEIKNLIQTDHIGKGTKEHFAFTWHKNILKNLFIKVKKGASLPYVKDIVSISQPLDIFIAGASNNLVRTLSNNRIKQHIIDKAIVIATDSAEGILNFFGVRPSIVISADASCFSLNLLSKWSDSSPEMDHGHLPMRLGNLVNQAMQISQGNYRFFFRNHPLEQLIMEFFELDCFLLKGSHVGAMALEIGERLATGKIYVSGMDLSYQGGVTYGHATIYTDFFLRNISRKHSFAQAMHSQLQRMKAYQSPDDKGLFRRASLDMALQELQLWIKQSKKGEDIIFLDMPQSLCHEFNLTYSHSSDIVMESSNVRRTFNEKQKIIFDSISLAELSKEGIKDFLNSLPDFSEKERVHQALYHHWPSEQSYDIKRSLALAKGFKDIL